MMRRRELITLLGGAATWPLAARAQQPELIRKVGVLTGTPRRDPTIQAGIRAFLQELQALKWIEGRNVHFVYSNGLGDLLAAARELVAGAPDVILVQSNPAVVALRQVDRTVPTVFVQVGDPVGSGFVEGLSRPGRNLTGFSTMEPEMGGKWLELLQECALSLARVLVLVQPDIAANFEYSRAAEAAAATLNIAVTRAGVADASSTEAAIVPFGRKPNGGLISCRVPLPAVTAN